MGGCSSHIGSCMGAWACIDSHSSFRSLANGREAAALAQSLLNSWTTAADGLADPMEGQDTHQEPPSHALLARHFSGPSKGSEQWSAWAVGRAGLAGRGGGGVELRCWSGSVTVRQAASEAAGGTTGEWRLERQPRTHHQSSMLEQKFLHNQMLATGHRPGSGLLFVKHGGESVERHLGGRITRASQRCNTVFGLNLSSWSLSAHPIPGCAFHPPSNRAEQALRWCGGARAWKSCAGKKTLQTGKVQTLE